MLKLKYLTFVLPILFVLSSHAQQSPAYWVNKTYRTATDLLNAGKYASAAEQFRQVENATYKTTTQKQFESEISLLKENAQYYEAFCALQLGNDDAESMFLRFIKEYPENPLAKLAYFQIGK